MAKLALLYFYERTIPNDIIGGKINKYYDYILFFIKKNNYRSFVIFLWPIANKIAVNIAFLTNFSFNHKKLINKININNKTLK